MLVLSRKVGEEIVLPNRGVTIGVVAVNGKRVRLGIAASLDVPVRRGEVLHRSSETGECAPDSGEADSEASRIADGNGSRHGSPTAIEFETDWQHEVSRAIASRTHGRVFSIKVEVIDECLIVHGRCRSYYAKQLAYAAALALMKSSDSVPFTQIALDIDVDPCPSSQQPDSAAARHPDSNGGMGEQGNACPSP